jgi:cell division protein FtsQ
MPHRAKRKFRRLKKKKERRMRSLAGRVAKGALSLAMMASLTVLGFQIYQYSQKSARFDVGEIKIMGCINATESELLNLAKVDFNSSLVNVDLNEISNRVAKHPWVKKANVKRDWSRKALVIEVQERTPKALVLFEDFYLIDQQAEIFKKAESKDLVNFPILTGLTQTDIQEHEKKAMNLVRKSLELVEILGQRKVFTTREVSEINLSKENGLIVYTLHGGIPIYMGFEEFDEKLDRLEKVLPNILQQAKDVLYLDLNYPKKVVVKMREEEKGKSHKS